MWLIAGVAVMSAILTGALHRYAVAYRVLDMPNARSAHTTPTPRGGGVAIVVSFLAAVTGLALGGAVDRSLAIALAGGGSSVALVGFLDDHRPLSVRWRLSIHICGAAWGLGWLGGLGIVDVAGIRLEPGWVGQSVAVVCLVWLLNLYNFMDGIDGLAALEAGTVCFGAAGVSALAAGADHVLLPALLGAAAFGFLVWNWPPARIFMGDAGSGFLGVTAGLLAIRGGQIAPQLLWAWLILLGVFVVDATVTLLRRMQRREVLYEAHRDHAFQHAARNRNHRRVTMAAGAINLLWLTPVSAAVALGWITGVAGLAIAYAPLVWLALHLKAGARTPQTMVTQPIGPHA